jgi:molybdate transport system permease protein
LALTLRVALVATLVNVPIALAVSWLVVRKKVRGRFVLEVIVSLPLALPPVVVGYFLLVLLGRGSPIGAAVHRIGGGDVVFTWVAAALAAAMVSFPLLVRPMMVAIGEVDQRVEMAARSLGAGPWRVALTITLPLAYRGIVAGVLLGFVRALSEFGATIVVAGNIPGKTQTLSLAIYSAVQLRHDAAAMRLVAVSIALAVATLAVHNWLLSRAARPS